MRAYYHWQRCLLTLLVAASPAFGQPPETIGPRWQQPNSPLQGYQPYAPANSPPAYVPGPIPAYPASPPPAYQATPVYAPTTDYRPAPVYSSNPYYQPAPNYQPTPGYQPAPYELPSTPVPTGPVGQLPGSPSPASGVESLPPPTNASPNASPQSGWSPTPFPNGIAAPEQAAPPMADPVAELVPEILVEPPPKPAPPPKLWEGSIELGGNGSEGNSENFNFRFLVNAKRTTDWTILKLNTRYINNSSNNITTVDRLFFEGRNEWLLQDTPWSVYIHETTEYDQYRAFDLRLTLDAGLAYDFIKTDLTTLQGRVGPGVSHEIGGPDESYVPEAVFGLSVEHKLTARSKVTASADYFPDISDLGEYRLNTQANWEFLLDEVLNISLKLGVLDRYDSTPNGAVANDLDYSATILWNF